MEDYVAQAMALAAMAKAKGGTTDAYTKAETDALLDGKADLVDGKIPASELPSYVDDVLEYASTAVFPVTGESGKIYIATDTNKTYRWSGTGYVEISESLALGETASTAYAGNKGKANADAISAIKDGTNIDSFADVETALANIPQVTVDQMYNAQSANAQSGTAVAEAIGSIPAEVKKIFSGEITWQWKKTTDNTVTKDFAVNKPLKPNTMYAVIIYDSGERFGRTSFLISGVANDGYYSTYVPIVLNDYVSSGISLVLGAVAFSAFSTPMFRVRMILPAAQNGTLETTSIVEVYEIEHILMNDSISADDYASQTIGGTVKAWTTTDGSDTILHLATQ